MPAGLLSDHGVGTGIVCFSISQLYLVIVKVLLHWLDQLYIASSPSNEYSDVHN